MRTVLRLLGTRYGIALVLVVIVLAVVGFGRTIFDSRTDGPPNDALGPTVAPVETTPDPFSSVGDDSVDDEPGSVAPSLSKDAPDATTVATRFANAWLRKPGQSGDQWRAGLKPHASAELMTELAETDPNDVPASAITGPVAMENFGQDVTARFPADGGTIVLELQIVNGRWQVTGLDWEAA
ncbi:hypothetical protein GCM10010399_51060 [Dactylosporangium fulvum]|uniref:DUF4878 domain-containing protein n=1 Tax=Dactylosporangium fulvum TaxID=53359 RepID=A0ABY5W2W6_9ACTN|nr:hypothetical protein [Dactylosporangium fulvum]UWP83399.1 hypothetical protein Dfulv_03630 [Dactylosporangium fulvum]